MLPARSPEGKALWWGLGRSPNIENLFYKPDASHVGKEFGGAFVLIMQVGDKDFAEVVGFVLIFGV